MNIYKGHGEAAAGFRGMRHDKRTTRAFFIIAHATHVQVWTLKPAPEREAAAMWALLDEAPEKRIDQAVAMQVYREATGRDLGYVH